MSILLVVVSLLASFLLMYWGVGFSGSDAVSLTTLGVACGFLNLIYPRLSTIAVAGMEVKLRRLTIEAEEEIEKLKKTKLKLYQISLGLVMKHEGGWASSRISDQRVPMMLELLSSIDKDELLNELKYSVLDKIEELMCAQIKGLKYLYSKVADVEIEVEEEEFISEVIKWRDEHVQDIVSMNQVVDGFMQDLDRELIWAFEMNGYFKALTA
ncbi:hypothetical protein QD172_03330 [Cobetia sp. 10Alg 146]|uniref:hypothetical protein n=1 Tax=Cobetia sp. 10Alg 146 TaxID=3040019 RepID=UPI0024499813|nr:hypothetical protein [Cobetia sp. 10Alg 146]MDH2290286.1 hypothetical protein [Cobetia sp. 10Alg 146]